MEALSAENKIGFKRQVSFGKYKCSKVVDNIKFYYSFGKTLGSGSFGTVYLCKNLDTNATVAIKKVKKSKLQENEIYYDLMENELKILLSTDHPHITRIFEICENRKNFYIVMELMDGGTLWNRIQKLKHFNEDHVASIIHQIMLALNYMHKQNVTHRDLKLENVMCKVFDQESNEVQVKITDFGFATLCNPNEKMDECLGTPVYMAPELCRMEQYDQRVDVWSLGIIAYLLLSGKKPFNLSCNQTPDVIRNAVLNNKLEFKQEEWVNVTSQAKDFVSQCLNKNANERATIENLFDHPWIKTWIQDPKIKTETALQITESLKVFHEEGILKSGVLSILSNLISTSEDLTDYIEAFEGLDKSHDGFISLQDLKKGLKQSEVFLNISDEEWEEILMSVDVNGDGHIDFTEFIGVTFDRQKLLTKQNIRKAFNLFDKDEDDLISKEDLQNVFCGGENSDLKEFEKTWKHILEESDLNKDNMISFEEFTLAMERKILEKHPLLKKQK